MNVDEAFEKGCQAFFDELGEVPFPICLVFNHNTIMGIIGDWVRANPERAESMLSQFGEIIEEYRDGR